MQYLKIHLNQPNATTHHLTAVTMHLLAGNNLAVFELERLERSVSSYLQMTDEHLKAFRYTLSLKSGGCRSDHSATSSCQTFLSCANSQQFIHVMSCQLVNAVDVDGARSPSLVAAI